jgi:SAM-dependent methyltransferase
LFPTETPWRSEARFFAARGDRAIAQRRWCRIAPQLAEGARLLEMGSGFGAFLGVAAHARADLQLYAVEPDLAHRERLLDGALVHFVAQLQALDAMTFDAVVAFHVLEHLPDPRGFLETLTQRLAPGGQAWIEVPDVMSHWRSRTYVQPAHLSYFSASLLRRLAVAAGLEVLECGPHPDGGELADNLWVQVRRPHRTVVALPLALAGAEELQRLDTRLDAAGWNCSDRLRRRLKQVLVHVFGPGLVGELQRWRHRRRFSQEPHDALR